MPLKKNNPTLGKEGSRRDFIKTAGLAAAAFSIVPRFVLGGPGFLAPSDTLYIAGIGVGGKGTSDLTGFARNPKAKFLSCAILTIVRRRNPKQIFQPLSPIKTFA